MVIILGGFHCIVPYTNGIHNRITYHIILGGYMDLEKLQCLIEAGESEALEFKEVNRTY